MVYVEPIGRLKFMIKKTELFMTLLMCNILQPTFQKGPKTYLIVGAAIMYLSLCFWTIYAYDYDTKMKCMCIVAFTFQVSSLFLFVKPLNILILVCTFLSKLRIHFRGLLRILIVLIITKRFDKVLNSFICYTRPIRISNRVTIKYWTNGQKSF